MRGDAIFQQYYKYALGPEYRRVEYLQSSGAQVLNTGARLTSVNSVALKFDLQMIEQQAVAAQEFDIFGNSPWSNAQALVGGAKPTGLSVNLYYWFYWHSSGSGWTKVIDDFLRHSVEFTDSVSAGRTFVIDGEETVISGTSHLWKNAEPLALFASCPYLNEQNELRYPITMNMFGAEIVTDGTLVRNLVPAVRVSDGKPGMYDLCGSICPLTSTPFYINAGSGADFTWGN